MEIGIKSKGSPEAIKPIHPTGEVSNDPKGAEGEYDTAVISKQAKRDAELLRLEALHEVDHTDGLVRRYMAEEKE
jgi:hypothetical protein